MTAKTKKGYRGHETHGADKGTAHARLMRRHTRGGGQEGEPDGGAAPEAPEPEETEPAGEAPEAPADMDDEDGEEAAEEDQS